MDNVSKSIHGVTIRLPNERWIHIIEKHAEIAGYLDDVLQTISLHPFLRTAQESCLQCVKLNPQNMLL